MPQVHWKGCHDVEAMAKVVGPRIKKLREARGLSLRDLAVRIDVSKNTVLRLEQGMPVAERLLERICHGLDTIPLNLMVSDEEWNRPFRIHRAKDSSYKIAFRRRKAPLSIENYAAVDSPEERKRLGNLGFVTGFFQLHESSLRDGKMQAAMLEIYGRRDGPGFRHPGEEYVCCLQGRLLMRLGREEVRLEPGDSIMFWSSIRHTYESLVPISAGQPPTIALMVWIESRDQPPMPDDPAFDSGESEEDVRG
jgi:transcriptional regulator with XRE-family HTH domain